MGTNQKRIIGTAIYHILVMGLGLIMIYPLVWMIMSSLKETGTIFTTAGQMIPTSENFVKFANYVTGWKGFGRVTFAKFFRNSLVITILATIGTVASSTIVSYGLARCKFPGRNILFVLVLATMMLPAQVLMIPQYLWYNKLKWVGTYLPLIVPFCFAVQGFFVYMMTNFIEGIPKELDEAAKIDGCSYYGIFFRVILPLMTPTIITSVIFSFIWRWDDYLGALLYLNKTKQYTVSIALKLFCDPGSSSDYGAMFAMATLSIVPAMLLFFFFQKYLVEGITTDGLKG